MKKADIALVGLAVMGENLVMNMERNGFCVAVFNRDTKKVKSFVEGRANGKNIIGTYSLEELTQSLSSPRKIMLMIKAGDAVDQMIENLLPYLDKGDIIIDGGNSYFVDTERRVKYLEQKGISYIGSGVSGGEEGALLGPSIMPGGSIEAWEHIKDILTKISAKVDGEDCCAYMGRGGAGHFVKMVHNGIEYGDMQLICEAYSIMKNVLKMSAQEMQQIFEEWNNGELSSYLIEITKDILAVKDTDGEPLVDKILDTAGQKGTGKWTSVTALDEGCPLTLISEAVFARCISAVKDERVVASKKFEKNVKAFDGDKNEIIKKLKNALYCAKIISYAQGYSLMSLAEKTYSFGLKMGEIAMIWRGGCIIRSVFLNKIKDAYDKNQSLVNLMLDDFFADILKKGEQDFREIVSLSVLSKNPVPAFSSALAYFDGYTEENLPTNLLQAQRDYFGAHQFERTDKNRGEYFHYNWTGRGGNTASSNYNV